MARVFAFMGQAALHEQTHHEESLFFPEGKVFRIQDRQILQQNTRV